MRGINIPDRQLLKPLQIVTKQGKGRAAGQAVQQTPCNRIAGEQNAGLPVEQEDASHRMTGNRDHIQNPSAEIKLHSIRWRKQNEVERVVADTEKLQGELLAGAQSGKSQSARFSQSTSKSSM